MLRSIRDVRNLPRIRPQIVQLLTRALRRRQFKELPDGRVLSALQEQRFDRPAIDISERSYREDQLGIAGGPALRPEIADVQKGPRSNGPDRIAQIVLPDVRVALTFEEHPITAPRRAPLNQ